MTIKNIIKTTLAILSMVIAGIVGCLGIAQGSSTICICVLGGLAIIWLIEAISCFHIVYYNFYAEKTYHIETRSDKKDLWYMGFAVFGLSIWLIVFSCLMW